MKEETKICGICLKEIKKRENYLKVILIENEKETEIKYAHISCWKIEFNQRKMMADSMKILGAAKGFLQEQGMIPPEVVNLG